MTSQAVFYIPESFSLAGLKDVLSDHHDIREISADDMHLQFFDTFDWRLFANNSVLQLQKNTYTLRKLYTNERIENYEATDNIVFLEDIRDKAFKQCLSPIKMRALLPLVEVVVKIRNCRIVDEEEKTVARISIEEYKTIGDDVVKKISPKIVINSLRGYAKEFKEIIQAFQSHGFQTTDSFDLFIAAVQAINKTPGGYSSKLHIQLSPEMRADAATKHILLHLLETMEINEPLILEDIDTEFLHDFRVAVRRSRSALSQMKGVFAEKITKKFKTQLAYVGRLTNKLRDLDVYALKEQEYKAMVPDEFAEGIDYVFELIHKKRKTAYLGIFRSFNATKYKKIKHDWRTFLEKDDYEDNDAPYAAKPIIDVAKERISKKYTVFLKLGKKIIKSNEEEYIHQLRIEGKKLRYLMEFFSSLFEKEKLDYILKQMKNVQDNLGDFNDYCVQQDYLLNFASELDKSNKAYTSALLAIGSLAGILVERKEQEKKKFKKIYKKFSSEKNQQLFQELFTL